MMERKTWIIALAVGATAATTLLAAGAIAKGGMNARMGHERPSFETLDTNGDGQITIAELQALATARFEAKDTNADGVISAEENSIAAAEKAAERAELMFSRLLEWRDSDGDGSLSQLEMGDNRAEKMFGHADADGDGVVTAEEFETMQPRGPGGRGRHMGKPGHSQRQGG